MRKLLAAAALAFVTQCTPSPAWAFKVGGMDWVTTDGTVNQCMKTDGHGNLGWLTVASPTSPTFSNATFTGTTTFPGATAISSAGAVGIGVAPGSPLLTVGSSSLASSNFITVDAGTGVNKGFAIQSGGTAEWFLYNEAGGTILNLDSGSVTALSATQAGAVTIPQTLGVTGVATFTAKPTLSSLTASQAVFSDASKGLVSNALTGTGNVVMSTSPTLVTPALGTPSALVGTNITGTALGLTAGNTTTNANLTGVITSVGNATSIGSQTGTGTKFVVDTGPTVSNITETGTTTGASGLYSGLFSIDATSASTTSLLRVGGGTNPLVGTAQVGVNSSFTGTSAATGSLRGLQTALTTAASTTVTNVYNMFSNSPTVGSGGAITNFADYTALGAAAHGATNNAAFTDNSGTISGNYFLDQTGTDQNLLMGVLQVGGTNPSTAAPFYGNTSSGVVAALNSTNANGGQLVIKQSGTPTTILGGAANALGVGSATDSALVSNGTLYLASSGIKAATIDTGQGVTLTSLAGSGTRAVTVNSAGLLGAGGTASFTVPADTSITTTGSGTYTIPANTLYLEIEGCAGGGAGGGTGAGAGTGGTGGTTSFGTSLISANGGTGGTAAGAQGTGGTASLGSGPTGIAAQGGYGGVAGANVTGGSGGYGAPSPFSGAGTGGETGVQTNGVSAIANSCSGGGGGSSASGSGAGGGASGGYFHGIISGATLTGLGSTAAYVLGTGGVAGAGAVTGGAGGSGRLRITARFQ